MSLSKFLKISTYLLCLTSCIACFLLTTTVGLGAIFKLVQCFVPGHLYIADVKGSISSFQMHQVFYRSNEVWVLVKRFELRWQPKQLLAGFVAIEKAQLSGLIIQQQSTKAHDSHRDQASQMPNFAWLSHIKLQELQFEDISVLQPQAKPIQIQSVKLTDQREGSQSIRLLTSFGNLHGRLKVKLNRYVSWQTKLQFEHINAAVFNESLDSDINFSIESQGKWSPDNKIAQVVLTDLHGLLLDLPVKGQSKINFANDQLQIEVDSLTFADAMADVHGKLGKVWDLDWNLKVPNFQSLVTAWHGNLTTSGTLKGTSKHPLIEAEWQANDIHISKFSAAAMEGKINSEMNAKTADLSVVAKKLNIIDYQIPESQLKVRAKLTDSKQVDTKLNLILGTQNELEGSLLFSNQDESVFSTQQKVVGTLKAQFNALNDLIVIPYVTDLKGILKGEIKLSGFIYNPSIVLQANIENGALKVPKLGMELNNIHLNNYYRSNDAFTFSGMMNAGKGNGVLNGNIFFHQAELPMRITLTGNDLELVNLPEYKATLSPSLELTASNQHYKLQGTIKIPKAHIAPKDFSNVQTLPSEVTIIDKNAKTNHTNTPTNLSMKLQVILGDDIKLQYQSLEAGLKGQIVITEKANSLSIASGELYTVNGKYKAYGRMLDITQGRLIYTGNLLTNPALDIRAQKQFTKLAFAEDQTQFNAENALDAVYQGSNELTAGIVVKGTLNSPYLSFFSDPPGLSQTDIISYLVFGYPRSKIKDMGRLALLNNIASSLNNNTSTVDKVTAKVQKVLGLTDISFDTVESYDPEEQTTKMNQTINIGKKFGKRFSVRYRVGVFNSISVLNLKYQINKRIAIQSETSSTDTGADLLFEYERD